MEFDKFKLLSRIDFCRRQGWMRLWNLLSIGWIVVASTQIRSPWHVPASPQSAMYIYNDENVQNIVTVVERQNSAQCESSTISITFLEFPSPPELISKHNKGIVTNGHKNAKSPNILPDESRKRWEAEARWINIVERPAKLWQEIWHQEWEPGIGFISQLRPEISSHRYPTHWHSISCVRSGLRTAHLARAATIIFAPPIIVPAALIAIFSASSSIFRWLINGFRLPVSRLEAENSSASQVTAENREKTKEFKEIKNELGSQHKLNLETELRSLRKSLTYSTLGVTVLDMMARSIISKGASHGTNALLFALEAIFLYHAAKRDAFRPEQNKRISPMWLAIFWCIAIATIILTTNRYW